MSNIVTYEERRDLAHSLVASKLFGIQTEDQALALMAICEAEGMHPARAVQEYHIIQGKPAIKADAMLARFQKAGGSVQWTCYTAERVCGVFSHPQGGSVEIDWTFAMARSIGLAGKDNWKNYPRAMLRARCISEGVRTVYPGISVGVYTVEEVQDMPAAQAKQMGNVEIVDAPPELIAKAETAVTEGIDAYSAYWQSISKEDRRLLATRHAGFKEKAQNITDGVVQ